MAYRKIRRKTDDEGRQPARLRRKDGAGAEQQVTSLHAAIGNAAFTQMVQREQPIELVARARRGWKGLDEKGASIDDKGYRDEKGYELADKGYGTDEKGGGFDDKGYGTDEKGGGFDDKGYGTDEKGGGFDDKGYGDEKGYELADKGFGTDEKGGGFDDKGFGTDAKGAGEQEEFMEGELEDDALSSYTPRTRNPRW